jgi:bacterial/archaeal transporter family protein
MENRSSPNGGGRRASTTAATRRRSTILPNGRRSSLIAFQNAALEIMHQNSQATTTPRNTIATVARASIGGRLGGALKQQIVDTAELLSLDYLDDDDDDETPDEGTLLLATKPKSFLAETSTIMVGPPLLVWITPAIACAAAYAFYNIFIKKGSASIHPILGGVILQFVAALLGTSLLGILVASSPEARQDVTYDRTGLLWSCAAGLAVGSAEMLSFCVSGMGVPATQSIPIIIGGSVLFGAVLGLIMLGEKLMVFHGWLGIALLVFGIGLVATDPGDKVEEGGVVVADSSGGGGAPAENNPPLLLWIGPALLCASAYAFYNIFIKKGSASINPILGGVVL